MNGGYCVKIRTTFDPKYVYALFERNKGIVNIRVNIYSCDCEHAHCNIKYEIVQQEFHLKCVVKQYTFELFHNTLTTTLTTRPEFIFEQPFHFLET